VIASTRQALATLRARPELRRRLWENARRLYRGLQDLGLTLGPEVSPIVAIRMNSSEAVVRCWCALLERGVYVNLVLPPATPDGGALLRCSMSAGHTPAHVDQIVAVFAALQAAGDIPGPAA
jgi:8-amino-7-oxononanoate synthase